MKKLLTISALVGVSLFLGSTAFAADNTGASGAAGEQVTITDSGGGSDLTINCSPGVIMKYDIIQNAYALSAMNMSASDGNRNMYGIWSGYSGYYQTADPASPAAIGNLTAPGDPSGTTTPTAFAEWTAMGGSGAGS